MSATETVICTRNGPWVEVRMARPPANALELSLVDGLHAALDACESDATVHGLLLTGNPGMFSGGLDVVDLRARGRAEIKHFWARFGELMPRLFATRLVTIAAIEGHAPAGGCVLAMLCDHRVMAEGRYKIGLNEVAVGLAVPQWLAEPYIGLVGQRVAERNLQLGRMVGPDEALAIGLVDDVVPQDAVRQVAIDEMTLRLSVPTDARRRTKAALRGDRAASMEAQRVAQLEALVDVWFSAECRAVMGRLVDKLSKKKSR